MYPYCKDSILKTIQWDYTKENEKVTPVYCTSNLTSFTITMKYKCKNEKCGKVVYASDTSQSKQLIWEKHTITS